MQDRFRALVDMLRLSIGAGEALIYTPIGRRAEIVGQPDLQLLSRCGRFATLHEHASRLEGPMVSPTTRLGSALTQLNRLVDRGLLVSERGLIESVRASAVDETDPPPITTIGMPTSGRHGHALAAIQSYVASAPKTRSVELVVAHDAQDDAESEALIAATKKLSIPSRITMRYIGTAQRTAYAAQLAREAEVDPALVRWALTRRHPTLWQAGANRNLLMLDAAGELALQLDDDIRSEIGAPPIEEPGLKITSAGNVMELWFPAPGHDAESLVEVVPGDVLAVHERMLGRSLSACVAQAPELDLGDVSGRLVREVIEGRGRIRCSQMGLVGDSATGSLAHYLMLRGKSRERLIVSEASYDHAFASRQGARASLRHAVSDGTSCMSYALGLDLRALMPPFVPEGRNSDGVFGYVLRHCFRDSYFGYLPEVVAHRPSPRRSSMEDLIDGVRQIDVNDLLCRLIGASGLSARSADPVATLEALGAHLTRLGDLPLVDLEELVRTLVLRTRSRDLSMLRNTLATHQEQPPFWARDVSLLIERLSETVLDDQHTQPRDLMLADGPEAGRAGLKRVIGDYGALLQAWPTLFAAAQKLRAGGVRPSVPWP